MSLLAFCVYTGMLLALPMLWLVFFGGGIDD